MTYYARFPGTCSVCMGPILPGQAITWTRKGPKNVYHLNCDDPDKKYEPEQKPKEVVLPITSLVTRLDYDVFTKQGGLSTPWTDEQTEANRRASRLLSYLPTDLTKGGEVEDKAIEVSKLDTDLIPAAKPKVEVVAPNASVQQAVSLLMQALQPRVEQAKVDPEEVKRIVKEVISQEGALKFEFIRKELPPITKDLAHKYLPLLVDYMTQGEHAYLHGPHGSGKSTAAMQCAEILGRTYGYISLTPQTPESRLIGYMNATGVYVKTQFREVYEHGGIFCVDEMDNGSPSLLTTLNGALENGHMAFPDVMVTRHEHFVLVGTGNTSGKGANPSYPERRPFDAAFADRFQYIEWGYDEKLEKKIAKALNPDAVEWTAWVLQIRRWAEKNHPRFVPSPRASFRIARGLAMKRDIQDILDSAVWRGDSELKSKVLANCPLPS